MELHTLPTDMLREIFARVELPYVLKLVCRALRDAAPKHTRTTPKVVAQSIPSLRVARRLLFPFCWDDTITCAIAEVGSLETLKWAHEVLELPITKRVGIGAAERGKLDMVRWITAFENDFEFVAVDMGEAAAGHGHFPILEYLHLRVVNMSTRVTNAAAGWGDLKTFQWLLDCKTPVSDLALEYAARGSGQRKSGDHKAIMDLILRQGKAWRHTTFVHSVQTATLDVLKWMRMLGCHDKYPELTMMSAAGGNRRDVLAWLMNDVCSTTYRLDARVAWSAARCGHLELLQWLRDEGCPWDYRAAQSAAHIRNLHVFRWMARNGGHIFHKEVRLHKLYGDLLRTPTGPLIHQMVPDAAWVYRLMCWRKVKLMVVKFGIARYWKSLCSPAPA